MKILITGAFGFVGTNLSLALKTTFNCQLIALDVKEPDKHKYDVFYSWNDLDKIDWSQIDSIIHLAGKAHDTKNQTKAEAYFEINTGLTQKIFDWFLKSKAKKFIFFSSVKAVADSVEGEVLTEDVLPAPKGPYGESKLAAEKYILQNKTEGKQVYILRPCMIHGPGNQGNLNLLYRMVNKGIPWPLGAFDNQRSFCSIDNLNFVINRLIKKDIESGIYQVADDQSLSTNNLVKLIAESLEKTAIIWQINQTLIRALAKIGDFLHLPLNSERLKKLTESYVVSNQKLKNALGIQCMPYTATEGMNKTLDSFRVK